MEPSDTLTNRVVAYFGRLKETLDKHDYDSDRSAFRLNSVLYMVSQIEADICEIIDSYEIDKEA